MQKLLSIVFSKLPEDKSVLVSAEPKSITFFNPYSLYIAVKNDVSVYKSFDYICFDGFLLPHILKVVTGRNTPRLSFDMTSLAPIVFNYLSKEKKDVFFIGSTQDHIDKFVGVFKKEYPDVNIAGYRNGFFSKEEKKEFTKEISKIKPDFVIVGMGTPCQDIMIAILKSALPETSFYSCGGFFHQSAHGMKYYPEWVDKLNLRWLYRIYTEPKLLKRYLFFYPISIYQFIYFSYKYK